MTVKAGIHELKIKKTQTICFLDRDVGVKPKQETSGSSLDLEYTA